MDNNALTLTSGLHHPVFIHISTLGGSGVGLFDVAE